MDKGNTNGIEDSEIGGISDIALTHVSKKKGIDTERKLKREIIQNEELKTFLGFKAKQNVNATQINVQRIRGGYTNSTFAISRRVLQNEIEQSSSSNSQSNFPTYFIKINHHPFSKELFECEIDSLTTLSAYLITPQVLKLGELTSRINTGSYLILEFFDFEQRSHSIPHQKQAAQEIASMHLNSLQHNNLRPLRGPNQQFGYHRNNFYGLFKQPNSWCETWPEFYAKNRLSHQLKLLNHKLLTFHSIQNNPNSKIVSKSEKHSKMYQDILIMGNKIISGILQFFYSSNDENSQTLIDIKPCLLHGDLANKNWSICSKLKDDNTKDFEMIVFDGICYYGHSEMELALMHYGETPILTSMNNIFKSYRNHQLKILKQDRSFINCTIIYTT